MNNSLKSYIEGIAGIIEFCVPKELYQKEYLTPRVKIGDKLNHKRFGEGHVIEIIDKEKVLIQFDGFTKVLLAKFAGFKTL